METMRKNRPPSIPGTRPATSWDAWRISAWILKNALRSLPRRAPWQRALRSFVVAWFCLLWPLYGLAYLLLSEFQGKTFYFSEAKDAVVALRARGTAWFLGDHLAATIGLGQGRRLRVLLTAPLIEAANRQGITLMVVAANATLANLYAAQLPGGVQSQVLSRGRVRLTKKPSLDATGALDLDQRGSTQPPVAHDKGGS